MTLQRSRGRLMMIALDALPPHLLDRWCHDGTLPNLRQAREEGRTGPVESDAEFFPGSVWPTFFTAADVSHHATFHFLQWDPDNLSFRIPGPDWLTLKPFWEGLARRGVPVITLDVPFTHLNSEPPSVTSVLGWGTHESSWSSSRPPGLLRELNKRFGASSQIREVPGPRSEAALRGELEDLIGDVSKRAAIIEFLALRFEWDLLLAVFSETHRAGHWYWTERCTGEPQGGLKAVLVAIDAVLPRLRALLRPEDHLVVFSVHGMGPRYDAERFTEAISAYLEPARRPGNARLADPIYALRRVLPPGLLREAVRLMPKATYNRLFAHYANAGREWPRHQVIANPLEHILYLTANRGVEKPDVLARVRSELEAITATDGSAYIESIIEPSRRYAGPRLRLLPDLVAVPRRRDPGSTIVMKDGSRVSAVRRSWQDGEHTAGGFYLQLGRGIEPGPGPALRDEDLAAFLCEPAGLSPH